MSGELMEIDGIIDGETTFRLPNDRIAELERKVETKGFLIMGLLNFLLDESCLND